MEFKELMTARYSVRKFKSEPVSDMEIQELLESLRIAPTAEIVVLMQIGHPAEDSSPIVWHTKKRPAAELFATL